MTKRRPGCKRSVAQCAAQKVEKYTGKIVCTMDISPRWKGPQRLFKLLMSSLSIFFVMRGNYLGISVLSLLCMCNIQALDAI